MTESEPNVLEECITPRLFFCCFCCCWYDFFFIFLFRLYVTLKISSILYFLSISLVLIAKLFFILFCVLFLILLFFFSVTANFLIKLISMCWLAMKWKSWYCFFYQFYRRWWFNKIKNKKTWPTFCISLFFYKRFFFILKTQTIYAKTRLLIFFMKILHTNTNSILLCSRVWK